MAPGDGDEAGVVSGGMDWEVRQGDCLDPHRGLPALADLSVDVVITDPAYSERVHRAQRRGLMSAERRGSEKAAGGRVRELGFGHLTAEVRAQAASELADISFGLMEVGQTGGGAAVRSHLHGEFASRYARDTNSWKTALYEGLYESDWFCNEGYRLVR